MTKRRACAAGLAAITISCGPIGRPTLDDIGERYVKVALQLAQHNPDLVDDWRGPEAWKPGPREPVAQLVTRIDALFDELKRWTGSVGAEDRYRLNNLAGQLYALTTLAHRLNGGSTTFDEELRHEFPVPSGTKTDLSGVPGAHAALEQLLPGRESLATRYAAYRKGLAVPAAKVEAVMKAALAACRDASGEMRLPADERVDLVFGHGSQWDGFARYLGNHRTRIEINLDPSLDVTRALRLSCHEGYPGHHAQNVLIDDELVRKRGWTEFALTPGFGPFLFITEGAAEVGADLAFPPAKRTELYRHVLLPAAGVPPNEAERLVRIEDLIAQLEPVIADVSRAYLDNTLTQAAAIDRLRDEALTPNPEALLAFAERRRSRIMAYSAGRAAVQRTIGSAGIAGLRRMFTDEPFTLH